MRGLAQTKPLALLVFRIVFVEKRNIEILPGQTDTTDGGHSFAGVSRDENPMIDDKAGH